MSTAKITYPPSCPLFEVIRRPYPYYGPRVADLVEAVDIETVDDAAHPDIVICVRNVAPQGDQKQLGTNIRLSPWSFLPSDLRPLTPMAEAVLASAR